MTIAFKSVLRRQVTIEVRSLVERGEIGAAHACLRAAESDGITTKLRTYRTLIDALVERCDVIRVLELHTQVSWGGALITQGFHTAVSIWGAYMGCGRDGRGWVGGWCHGPCV